MTTKQIQEQLTQDDIAISSVLTLQKRVHAVNSTINKTPAGRMVINIQVDRRLWMVARQQIEVGAVDNEMEGLLGFKVELKDRVVSLQKALPEASSKELLLGLQFHNQCVSRHKQPKFFRSLTYMFCVRIPRFFTKLEYGTIGIS